MHEHEGPRPVEPGLWRSLGLHDRLDRLQLAEMIAAADGAERGIERRRLKPGLGQGRSEIAVPGAVERAQALGGLVDAQLAHRQVELEQAHAAADVRADELRMDAVGQDAAAHRPPFAGMQVRHGGHGLDAGQRGDSLQLLLGVALDPGSRRIEGVDRRAAVHGGCCAHWVCSGSVWRRPTRSASPALVSGACAHQGPAHRKRGALRLSPRRGGVTDGSSAKLPVSNNGNRRKRSPAPLTFAL